MLPHRCPHPYHQTKKRQKIEKSAFYVVIILLVVLFFAGRLTVKTNEAYAIENQALIQQVADLKGRIKALEREHDFSGNAQRIDAESEKASREAIVQLHAELRQAKEELSFLQRVVSPEDVKTGVYVHSFDVTSSGQAGNFLYQLVLAQGLNKRRAVKGQFDFVLKGKKNGEVAELKFGQAFSFRYFQMIEDEIQLPEGFQPDSVFVTLKPTTSGMKSSEEQLKWEALLSE